MFDFLKKIAGSHVQNNTITTSRDLADVLLGGGIEGIAGITVTPKTAMGVAAVQAAVRVIAENVGMLPFPLYKRIEKDGQEFKEKARDHVLWRLLNVAPNGFQSAQEFREYMVGQMLLYRNAYAFKNKINGAVRELVPIHANRVSFKQNANLEIVYSVTMENGQKRDFPQADIFHLRDMSAEGLSGRSRVQECRDVIGLAKAAENYGGEFFKNDRTPSGILSSKENLNKEQIDKIRQSWNGSEGGKRGGVKVVDNAFEWTSIGTTAQDAQMIETRKFQVTEVARIFRIPPHKIADNERATFNNIEAQELDFQINSMMPWYRRFELGVDVQLLSDNERATHFAKIDNRAMLRGDSKARGEFYQKMKVSKILTTNEIRDLEDMNPHPDGDVLENPTAPVDNAKGNANDPQKSDDPAPAE